MHIRDEQRAKPSRGVIRHGKTISDAMIMADIYQSPVSVL
jgi:hypothetical protein